VIFLVSENRGSLVATYLGNILADSGSGEVTISLDHFLLGKYFLVASASFIIDCYAVIIIMVNTYISTNFLYKFWHNTYTIKFYFLNRFSDMYSRPLRKPSISLHNFRNGSKSNQRYHVLQLFWCRHQRYT